MKTILLGQNKIPVPAIIQGTMRFDRLTTNEVAAMFHNDLENGTNFVDTANCYGKPEGLVESIIGKTFAENPGLRDKLVLQSKGRHHLLSRWPSLSQLFQGAPAEDAGRLPEPSAD